ncbi:hypothetical protein MCUN1_001539 [Malassezia cuniculi]|uniref:N-acetyltransferase domain-containing protein n=1 Tax=Malassezia cuniculi TaxID=948313 RepID=A0AAF0J640_9BASI|nr:hypothetical protein MCUN1_001539 [Malassezia cuniculi]
MPLGRKSSGKFDTGDVRAALSMTPVGDGEARSRISFPFSASGSRRNTDSQSRSSSSSSVVGVSSNGHRSAITFDYLKSDEVRAASTIARATLPKEDSLSFEVMINRQKAAPHLFYGAFVDIPQSMPIAAGPLSVSGSEPRRRLIGFCTATAAPAMIAQSFYGHSTSDLARIVCIHLVCVEKQYRHQGLGLRLLAAFIDRIQTVESGQSSEKPHGYEVISLICREQTVGFFMKAGFKFHGVSHISRGTSNEWIEMRRPVKGSTPRFDSALTFEDLWHPDRSSLSIPLSAQTTIEQQQSRSFGDTPNNICTESPLSVSPPMTQEKMLAALLAQSNISEGTARDLGISPTQQPQLQRSTSSAIPLSVVFGRAVAAKTPWEDSLDALVAHLVEKSSGTNRARLYCPDESCNCSLIAKNTAVWETKEFGPLVDTNVMVRNKDGGSSELQTSLAMDQLKFSWPEGRYTKRDQTVGVARDPIGPIRGMWVLSSPMQFDNVSFSHDVAWKVPPPTVQAQSPVEAPKEKKRQMSMSMRSLSTSDPQRGQTNTSRETDNGELPSYKLGVVPGETRTIKYITCPDCGAGPLGFMLVSSEGDASANGYSNQKCYVSASRVRYEA